MGLSRSNITSPVLMSSKLVSTLERWFTGVRLLGPYRPEPFELPREGLEGVRRPKLQFSHDRLESEQFPRLMKTGRAGRSFLRVALPRKVQLAKEFSGGGQRHLPFLQRRDLVLRAPHLAIQLVGFYKPHPLSGQPRG